MRPVLLASAVVVVLAGSAAAHRDRASGRSFDCRTTFTRNLSADDLVRKFGAAVVTTGDIYLGEGEHEQGAILFDDAPADRVEVLWNDREAKRQPRQVRLKGTTSHWRTPLGMTLGDTLRRVEAINRRPFRLLGYGSEGDGGVVSWSGGELATLDAADCRTRARLVPVPFPEGATQRIMAPIWTGNQEFSSGHPAFQALQPKVTGIFLDFDRRDEFVIRRYGVGPISIGMTEKEVARLFAPERQRKIQLAGEGETAPALELTVPVSEFRGGLVAEFLRGPGYSKVERIQIKDPALRTSTNIGVGSTVASLRSAYLIKWVGSGEGSVFMRVEDLSASFELDRSGPLGPSLSQIRDPAKVPGDVKIIRILLTGAS